MSAPYSVRTCGNSKGLEIPTRLIYNEAMSNPDGRPRRYPQLEMMAVGDWLTLPYDVPRNEAHSKPINYHAPRAVSRYGKRAQRQFTVTPAAQGWKVKRVA